MESTEEAGEHELHRFVMLRSYVRNTTVEKGAQATTFHGRYFNIDEELHIVELPAAMAMAKVAPNRSASRLHANQSWFSPLVT